MSAMSLKASPIFSVASSRFNVVILAAGLGTRLQPATLYLPKPLVEVGEMRAIDHLLRKYQYIAERFVIASGYGADLLENYVRGRYGAFDIRFSREPTGSLAGPGKSFVLALDNVDSTLPTLVTFCDYLIGDEFSVDADALAVCRASEDDSILGTYKTVAVIEEGVITDLVANPDLEHARYNGFSGIAVCHDTLRLKAIAYGAASAKGLDHVHYAFDIIAPYVHQVRTVAAPLTRMLEFGTEDTLVRTRGALDASEADPA